MTFDEAVKLRNEYIKILVGRPYDGKRPDWAIEDVIVSDKENAAEVYTQMYKNNLSNETVLHSFSIKEDSFDVLIIAHQQPWEKGNMLVESVQQYVKINAI